MEHYLLPDIGRPGKIGCSLPHLDVTQAELPPKELLRQELELPEVSEVELVRYFTALSKLNYGVDTGFYPLGSCTMKYNPKWHEDVAQLPGFASIHPYQPIGSVQGALQLMFELEEYLAEITGMSATSLAPMAGAEGELASILMVKAYYHLPYDRVCMHKVVFSGKRQKAKGVKTLDIAKRLLDYGFHPPTVYFPLVVEEAIMLEPTETESKETLDAFIDAMKEIARDADENPEILRTAPHNTPIRRLDEVTAARNPDLRWEMGKT